MESGTQKPNEWYTVELNVTKNWLPHQIVNVIEKFIGKKVQFEFIKTEHEYVETQITILRNIFYNDCDNTVDMILQAPSGEIVVKVSDDYAIFIGELIVKVPLPLKLIMYVKKDT